MKTALAVTGTVLFGALLLGAPDASAAPPPVHPTDVRAPIAQPEPYPPTRGHPEVADPATDIAVADPCTENCEPSGDPTEPSAQPGQPGSGQPDNEQSNSGQPIDEPAAPPRPSARPVDQPRSVPVAIPVPSRIDTGEGPGDLVNWWLVGVSALALLGLAAGGGFRWIRRGERSAR
jgi:hypothetical protein